MFGNNLTMAIAIRHFASEWAARPTTRRYEMVAAAAFQQRIGPMPQPALQAPMEADDEEARQHPRQASDSAGTRQRDLSYRGAESAEAAGRRHQSQQARQHVDPRRRRGVAPGPSAMSTTAVAPRRDWQRRPTPTKTTSSRLSWRQMDAATDSTL
jgi:hypothetical protein